MPFNRRISFVVALALIGGAAWGCNRHPAPAGPPKPQDVMFTTPVEDVITEFEEFTGRTFSVKSVDIRARVSGYLEKVEFVDGADVKKGAPLFEIDSRSYKAAAAQAASTVDQYLARIERMERSVARAKQLMEVEKKAISIEQYEQQQFDLAEAKATLQGMIAAKEMADLQLSFTKVTAPFDGRISRRMVDPGNLVQADSSTLATIVALDPIYAYFDIDERTVLKLQRLVHEGVIKATRESKVEVQVALADDPDFKLRGIVDFVDNQVDQTTGTLRMRAVIPNQDRLLTPGLFVRLRFPVGDPHPALLIPEEALATDQDHRFVYVIDNQDHVVYRPVKIGVLIAGRRVITEGLQPTDRVAVTGLQRLKKNAPVIPKPWVNRNDAVASPEQPAMPPTAQPASPPAGQSSPAAARSNPSGPSSSPAAAQTASRPTENRPAVQTARAPQPATSPSTKADTANPAAAPKDGAKAGATGPVAAKASATKGEGTSPAAVKSNTIKPNAAKAEAVKPRARKPEVAKAASANTEGAKVGAAKAVVAKPETSKPETAKPAVVKEKTAKSTVVKPSAAKESVAKTAGEKADGVKDNFRQSTAARANADKASTVRSSAKPDIAKTDSANSGKTRTETAKSATKKTAAAKTSKTKSGKVTTNKTQTAKRSGAKRSGEASTDRTIEQNAAAPQTETRTR
ncbi:MAG TPA: efflux RND transporter periplasmic adaptor subunit [Pirellulales bacterium]|jgi:RND family efflux transporter MFP subunit